MYSMGVGGRDEEACAESSFSSHVLKLKLLGLRLRRRRVCQEAAFLNIRLSTMVACIARRVARRLRWGWLCWLTRPGNY